MALDRSVRNRRPVLTGSLVLGLVVSVAPLTIAGAPAAAAPLTMVPATVPTMPVYAVKAAGLTKKQAAALGNGLGIRRLARAGDGSVRFAAENTFLAVPTKPGDTAPGHGEDDQATTSTVLDMAALRKLQPISGRTALDKVKKALAAARLTPSGGVAAASHTTLKTVNANGEPTASAALDTTVSYTFRLGGLPYEGPGAKVRVGFDAKGGVNSLAYSTRTLRKAGSVVVLDTKAGLARCTQAMGGKVVVQSAVPAYYAPNLATKLRRLDPSFRCSGVNRDGSVAQVIFVPAAASAVVPALPPAPPPRDEEPAPSARVGGVVDVGSEGTGACSGLGQTGANLKSFNKQFENRGIDVRFSWLDQNAWEDDFKDPAFSGNDTNYADNVDMTYWQGHGSPTGFSFSGCSSKDDAFLANTDARWGNNDVEWMSLFTCLILADTSGGQQWWQRWGRAFDGLHQINSFHTVSYHSGSHGGTYANYLLRKPFLWWNNPMPVRSAWAQASIDDQPASVVWASMGPIGAGGAVNLHDYFWNKGAVGPDIPASAVTGYWYLTGSS